MVKSAQLQTYEVKAVVDGVPSATLLRLFSVLKTR